MRDFIDIIIIAYIACAVGFVAILTVAKGCEGVF